MEDAISFSDRVKMAKFVLSANKFTYGERVKEVEKQWNEWLGSKNSLFVSSGSTANFLLLSAIIEKYNLKKGSKILVPACTWMTNVAPIIQLGMKPIFCDIQIEDFSFSYPQLSYIAEKHPEETRRRSRSNSRLGTIRRVRHRH
jgi:CDP-6-deoxy-D-xylo-4-hexulose-3-dehydrase